MISWFSVVNRNPGHWDISVDGNRVFCIRGEPGKYLIRDERSPISRAGSDSFPTVDAAMAWICSTLMYEGNQPENKE